MVDDLSSIRCVTRGSEDEKVGDLEGGGWFDGFFVASDCVAKKCPEEAFRNSSK